MATVDLTVALVCNSIVMPFHSLEECTICSKLDVNTFETNNARIKLKRMGKRILHVSAVMHVFSWHDNSLINGSR